MNLYRTLIARTLFAAMPALLLLSGCNKESDPNPDTRPASMECKVESNNWRASSFTNRLSRVSTTMYTGKQLNISAVSLNGTTITLSISDPSTGVQGDGIKPDTYFTNVALNLPPDYQSGTPAKAAIGTYVQLTIQKIYVSSPGEGEGRITVTACDATRKTISGTFSFTAGSMTEATSLAVTDGTFTNLSYSVAD